MSTKTKINQKWNSSKYVLLIAVIVIVVSTTLSIQSFSTSAVIDRLNLFNITTDPKVLTSQEIINMGCNKMSSNLVQNKQDITQYTFENYKTDAGKYSELVAVKSIDNSNQFSIAQTAIDTLGTTVDSKEYDPIINNLRDKLLKNTQDLKEAIIVAQDVLNQIGPIGKNLVDQEWELTTTNHQEYADFLMNLFDAKEENLFTKSITNKRAKTDIQALFNSIRTEFTNQYYLMADVSGYFLDDLNAGFGNIKNTELVGDNCKFTIQGQNDKLLILENPVIKQFVCELKNPDILDIQEENNNCVEYKN